VEEAAVGTGADLIDDVGLQIAVDGTGDVFALTCTVVLVCGGKRSTPCRLTGLGEEGAEALIVIGGFTLLGKIAIGLLFVILAAL